MAAMATVRTFGEHLTFATSTLLVLGLLYVLGIAAYNIFLHPLRSYPGPLLWRISSIPWDFHRWNGTIERRIQALHLKYGLTIRVGPNELSFASSQAFNDILAHRAGQPENSKASSRILKPVNGISNILNADRDDHARFRRLLAHAFSEKGLQAQQGHIQHHVDLLVRNLREVAKKGESTDMLSWFTMTLFDAIGDLAWGESFGCLERGGQLHDWVPAVMGNVKFINREGVLRSKGLDFLNPLFRSSEDMGHRMKNHNYAGEKVKQRAETQGQARGDFWDRILIKSADDNKAGEGMTEAEMLNNASVLVLGGSETSATTLSGTMYLLARNPATYERLAQEVRASFDSEEEIDAFSVQKLKYMFAVLEESMRYYPPVPSPTWRQSPKGGVTVCDRHVPEGTILDISVLAAQNHPSNFHDPEGFHPERWLADAPAEFANDDRKAFMPFSLGARNCIGRNLAYAEMRLILARLLWNFDFELDVSRTGQGNWFDQKAWALWDKQPLFMRVIPRPGL